ncbi:hypothetical protein LINPERPRIM_LOCUS25132, partial [Linum perenne]
TSGRSLGVLKQVRGSADSKFRITILKGSPLGRGVGHIDRTTLKTPVSLFLTVIHLSALNRQIIQIIRGTKVCWCVQSTAVFKATISTTLVHGSVCVSVWALT